MKKVLYGTTALVSAGVLASSAAHAEGGIKLGLGGYMNNFFVGGDADDDGGDYSNTGMFSDGEVWFVGETTLDNGLTFGANIQLESFTSGDQIDENYGYMQGSFGRLLFGSENTAAYLMQYSAPSVGVPINSGWVTSFIPVPSGFNAAFRSPAVSTFLDTGNDENTLTYFTPRFFGFQFGTSYQAALNFSGDGANFPVQAEKDTEYQHGIAVGLNFVESFNGVDIAVAGGYRRAESPGDNNLAGDNLDDISQVSTGINIGFAGFTIGGSYANEIEGREIAGADRSTEGWSYDVGISYSTGPWSFGGTYFHGQVEDEDAISEDDKLDAVEVGVQYAVGPGIRARGGVMFANYRGETGLDNKGIVGAVGLSFGF